MGFEDFKAIEKCIVKLEERLVGGQYRKQQRAKRRELLKQGDKQKDAYWKLLEEQFKEENNLLRKISKSVVAHFNVSADVY